VEARHTEFVLARYLDCRRPAASRAEQYVEFAIVLEIEQGDAPSNDLGIMSSTLMRSSIRTTDESSVELGSATSMTGSRLLLICAYEALAQGTILFGPAQAIVRDTSAADDSRVDELILRHLRTVP
jgi:hypothetical protein